MKKAVGAILWHCTNFKDENYRHRFCPPCKFSWCKWQKEIVTGKKTYKNNIDVPRWIHDIVKPIFEDLNKNTWGKPRMQLKH